MTVLVLLSAADSAAFRTGQMAGGIGLLLALLAGAVKSAAIARRRTVSSACAYALMLALLGAIGLAFPTVLRTFGADPLPIVIALYGHGLLLLVAGAVLAIVGLASYSRHPEYTQGRTQAVGALALTALLCQSLAIAGLVKLVQLTREETKPNERAQASPDEPFGEYRSPGSGFAIDLRFTAWRKWADASQKNPEAEVGGLASDGAGFLITPFAIEGDRPHLDALTHAALKEWGIEFPSPAITHLERLQETGMEGYRFQHQRQVGDTAYDYRMRILQGEGRGFFVSVWQAQGKTAIEERALEVFNRLRFVPVPVRPIIARLPRLKRLAHGRLYNRIGLYHFDAKDYATGLRHFQVAVRADPGERTYLINALRSWGELERWKDGLDYLLNLDHPLRRDNEVRSWEAWFKKQDGQREAALAIYRDLFVNGHRDDEDFEAYAALLAGAGRWTDLRRAFDLYLAQEQTIALRLTEARLFGEGGRHQDAVDVLEQAQRGMPFSPRITWALLEHHDALEQHRQRIALCEALIGHGFASADVYYAKGDAEAHLKLYRNAKGSFEAALKHKPNDAGTLDYLQHLSAQLGEGNNSEVKDTIPPVPLPQIIAERLSRLSSAEVEGLGALYVYWVEGFFFERNREARSTTRQRIKVSDRSGVERFSTLAIDFDPIWETVYVNELTVRDAADTVVAQGQASDSYVIDKQEGESATHDKTLFLPVPSLEPGSIIDLTFTRRERGKASEFLYRTISLGGDRLVEFRSVYYLGEPGEVRHHSANGVRFEPIPGGLMWSAEKPAVYPWEPLRVASAKVLPTVWIGDANAQWPGVVQAHLRRIEEKLVATPEVTAEARRLTEGITDPGRRTEILARYVQSTTVYKPIEFGRRAQIPNRADETLRRKYGDCKDHSVLLKQLLEAVAVPAQLALVSTEAAIQKDIPSLEQFNHVIVFVPGSAGAGGRFYDTTDKGLSMAVTPPLALAERDALIVDANGGRFERLPPYGDDSSELSLTRDLQIASPGGLLVTETVALTGYFAATLRDHLLSLDPDKHKDWGQDALAASDRHAQLRTLASRNLRDPDQPLIVEVSYELPERCRPAEGGLRCALPAIWESRYLAAETVSERRTPFALTYPLRIRSVARVHAPEKAGQIELTQGSARGQAEPIGWSFIGRSAGPSAGFEFDCRLARGEYPAAGYAEYVRTIGQALRAASPEIVWRRPPE